MKVPQPGAPVALRHDTIRRAIEVDGRVSIADLKDRLLADHDKIGAAASAFVGDISCADLLITDTGADPSALANLRSEGLNVVTADPSAG